MNIAGLRSICFTLTGFGVAPIVTQAELVLFRNLVPIGFWNPEDFTYFRAQQGHWLHLNDGCDDSFEFVKSGFVYQHSKTSV